jgi:CubicO group peptidase (beta-lactamase class C family)
LESRTPMRQDHIFYVASLTKTFTAVMMMQYVQEKKISLDDYVLDYPFRLMRGNRCLGESPTGLS